MNFLLWSARCSERLAVNCRPPAADKAVVPNCANCGAPVRVDTLDGGLVCDHCGSMEPHPSLIRRIDILCESSCRCPMCAIGLASGKLDGLPLRVCRTCEGMLISMEHFVAVIDAARAYETPSAAVPPPDQRPGARTLRCPGCGQPMLNHFYGGPGNLVIDTCERCNLNWLDRGELRRIARAP